MLETNYRHNDDFAPKVEKKDNGNLIPETNTERDDNKEKSEVLWSFDKLREVWEKRRKIDQLAIKEVKRFVDALDSYKNWLTKKLLDIHKNLKEVEWLDEATLWNESFRILLATNDETISKMPDTLKTIFGKMLKNLADYDDVKNNKAIPLEKKMLACLSMNAISQTYASFWDRIFMPWNIDTSSLV